jgi:hypothetical protein
MVRTALGLVVSLMLAGALAAGPAVAADAPARCRAGYQLRKKRGVRRCVRKPDEPKPPRDAVTPSSIELIVGTLKQDRFGATGFMRFPGPVTGTAYGEWVLSNGVTRAHPVQAAEHRRDRLHALHDRLPGEGLHARARRDGAARDRRGELQPHHAEAVKRPVR